MGILVSQGESKLNTQGIRVSKGTPFERFIGIQPMESDIAPADMLYREYTLFEDGSAIGHTAIGLDHVFAPGTFELVEAGEGPSYIVFSR